jgi:succinyl-diaminopimelate desuccinylase
MPGPTRPMIQDPIPLLQALLRAGADASCQAAVQVVREACPKAWRVVEGKGFVWVQPGDRARLVLSGHLDVVPAGPGWTRDPFGAALDGGEVWGRGAADMKGAVAAMLTAAQEVGEGDWALALTTDEETGMAGAKALAASGALDGADLVVIGEPTDLQLGVAHRGVLWLELACQGKAAHGGSPEKGDNAILKLLRLLQALDGFALPERHRLVGGSTLNLGTIEGGTAANVVPAHAKAQVDLRVPPPGATLGAKRALEAALGKAGVPYQSKVVSQLEPFQGPAGPMVDRVRSVLREARPGATEVGLPYTTEASVFQAHAPCLVAGPGALDRMHVPDERVAAADVRAALRFYRGVLRMWS